jgi:glycosyltransferase involved in cell wall biosynthesis
MRIAFNAFFLGQESTGSGQYTHQLLRMLPQLDECNEYLPYSPARPGFHQKPDPWMDLKVLSSPVPRRFDNLAKLWFEQMGFPRACRRASADLAHVPYFASPLYPTVPTVVTVHDLIPLLLPAYRGSLWVRLYMRLVAVAARRANVIITDSQHSKQDIVEHLRVPPERVRVVYLAADPDCRPVSEQTTLAAVRRKYGLPEAYVLYLGGFDQRKNLYMLLQAYARLCQSLCAEAPPLVVAGRLPPVQTPLFPDPRRMSRELGIEPRVIFTGWIAEQDKPALYSGALFFTFLSLYEGFGLMPLEAMSCGTPVLVSRTSSLPEIVGAGGLMVDPMDLDAIVEAMAALLQEPMLREQLRREAMQQAAGFDWARTAEQTLQIYHHVARGIDARSLSDLQGTGHFD